MYAPILGNFIFTVSIATSGLMEGRNIFLILAMLTEKGLPGSGKTVTKVFFTFCIRAFCLYESSYYKSNDGK